MARQGQLVIEITHIYDNNMFSWKYVTVNSKP